MAKVTGIDSPRGRSNSKTLGRSTKDKENIAKAVEAYELLLGGKSHSEIADIMGMAYDKDVYQLLLQRFQSDAAHLTEAERKDLLALETLRLNALQAAVWPAAMMGDPKSIDSAVRIIATRAKITGLEQVDPVVQKNLVLVMGDKEEDYIAALKASSD